MSSIGLYNSFSTEIEISLIHLIVKKKNTMTSYVPAPVPTSGSVSGETETIRIEAEVHILVTSRDKKYTNFIEYNNYKLIYRRYAVFFSQLPSIYQTISWTTW